MLAIFGVGESELIVIMLVALIVFGGKLPEVARSLGKSLSEFKRSIRGFQDEMEREYYRAGESGTTSYTPPTSYSNTYTPPEGYGQTYGSPDPYATPGTTEGAGQGAEASTAATPVTPSTEAEAAPAAAPETVPPETASPAPSPEGEAEKDREKDPAYHDGSVPPML